MFPGNNWINWQNIKNMEQGKYTVGIFLDLLKAFDSLEHSILLKKHNKYGVRGTSLDWFSSCLSDREMRIKCQTASSNRITYSEKYSIQYGTVQGSRLGPFLFSIFCNDIYKVVEQCKLILFLDDTTIFHSHKNINYLIGNLIHNLNLLFDWFKATNLSLNLEKSMTVSLGHLNSNFLTIEVDLTIPWVQEIKFLGIHIDTMLNWNHHYNLLYNKILLNNKTINTLPEYVNGTS